jgi:hypothetical protein
MLPLILAECINVAMLLTPESFFFWVVEWEGKSSRVAHALVCTDAVRCQILLLMTESVSIWTI